MAIKKIRVVATIEQEFNITIDDEIYNEDFMKTFGEVFHELDSIEDIAKDLVEHQVNYGTDDSFIEGFGNVTRDGKIKEGMIAAEGLNIEILDSTPEYFFEAYEI